MPQDDQEEANQFSERVVAAKLAPQSLKEYEDYVQKVNIKYGHRFRSSEECEYFAMLPLTAKQQEEVLKRMTVCELE